MKTLKRAYHILKRNVCSYQKKRLLLSKEALDSLKKMLGHLE